MRRHQRLDGVGRQAELGQDGARVLAEARGLAGRRGVRRAGRRAEPRQAALARHDQPALPVERVVDILRRRGAV